MNYKAYPKKADTPSRKARKASRNSVFLFNKYETRRIKAKERRERRAALEAGNEEQENP